MQQHALVDVGDLERGRRPRRRSQPSTSRSRITSRWPAGSVSIASSMSDQRLALLDLLGGPATRRRRPCVGRLGGGRRGRDQRSGVEAELLVLEPGAADAENGRPPPLALAPRLGPVGEDPEQPCAQARSALEASRSPVDGEPGLLHHLLRDRAVAHVHPRHPQHRGAVAAEQLGEGVLLASAQPLDSAWSASSSPGAAWGPLDRSSSRAMRALSSRASPPRAAIRRRQTRLLPSASVRAPRHPLQR